MELHKIIKEKDQKAREKLERKDTRERKAKLNNTVSHWTKKAQAAFNAYIRERDKWDPCISCGRMDREIKEFATGGKWDCGHYLSRGAFPELRFEPLNAHKQCKSCNGGSGKYARKGRTVSQEYRKNLEKKIGIEALEWLEGPHPQKRYRVEELKEIEAEYKRKLKELKNGHE